MGAHLYPTEFLVRTMLGRYPALEMSREYAGRPLLDLGFGDGRNLLLFRNLGVDIYGVEPDPEVCRMVKERVEPEGIACDLRVGHNSAIPFDDAFFDFVVASHSIYYVCEGESFADNLRETARVLKPGGWLVATVPDLDNAVLEDSEDLKNGHWRITSDPFDLRNGSIFWAARARNEITDALAPWFGTFSFATFRDDWYGLLVSGFVVVCQKRVAETGFAEG